MHTKHLTFVVDYAQMKPQRVIPATATRQWMATLATGASQSLPRQGCVRRHYPHNGVVSGSDGAYAMRAFSSRRSPSRLQTQCRLRLESRPYLRRGNVAW
ncbi:hypothetical protein LSAT2_006547 [Lamellibrachia satsuma]|nr:hypothetical protein LSAT2_006547 [Lamellibrachia satsuma]